MTGTPGIIVFFVYTLLSWLFVAMVVAFPTATILGFIGVGSRGFRRMDAGLSYLSFVLAAMGSNSLEFHNGMTYVDPKILPMLAGKPFTLGAIAAVGAIVLWRVIAIGIKGFK